jgi:hypothetical protein
VLNRCVFARAKGVLLIDYLQRRNHRCLGWTPKCPSSSKEVFRGLEIRVRPQGKKVTLVGLRPLLANTTGTKTNILKMLFD